jgi:accessory gene regulator protein AgrB
MKNSLLLPHGYKRIGIIVLAPSLVLGILVRFFDFQFSFLTLNIGKTRFNGQNIHLEENINLTDELALTGIITALLFIAFAREKTEDEYIAHTRLESLKWAVLINYLLLLLATWLVHGFAYIDVMMYNMLTVLIIFIVRFNYTLNSNKKITD